MGSPPVVSQAAVAQALSTPPKSPPGGVSPHAIVALWDEVPAVTTTDVLRATVANTTSEAIEVRAKLLAIAPTGVRAILPLGTFLVPASGRKAVPIRVRDIPVQTVGAATVVQFVAQYATEQPVVEAAAGDAVTFRRRALNAMALPRYVTSTAGFSAATVRTSTAQGEENHRASARAPAARTLSALRVFNEVSRSLVDVSVDKQRDDGHPAGVQNYFDVPLDELPLSMRTKLPVSVN